MTTKKSDIVFISPCNEKLGHFHSFVPRSIPIGVALLSGYLMKHGFTAEVVDEEIVRIDREFIARKLAVMSHPKIFGLSVMTTNSGRAYEIARLIKSLDKDAVVVAGGIHPTVMPEEVMAAGCVDYAVRGEGERPLLELVKRLKSGGGSFGEIKSLMYRGQDGKPVFNPAEDTAFDITELPAFPYELFDPKHYDLGFILTSRGCPFDCIFCSQRAITKRRYRALKNEVVIAELERLVNVLGQKNITFFDDFFTGDKKRVFELCALIRERGLHQKCSFGVQTRGDSVDRELLEEMKKSGFDSLMFGFETSSNRLMEVIQKSETVEDNVNAIKLAREIGFTVEATFIFGFPEETYADRLEALLIAKSIVSRARFNNATPYPGTKLYEMALKDGRLNLKGGWSNFSSAGAVTSGVFDGYVVPYSPEGTKPADLAGEVFFANLLFYINLSNMRKLFNAKKSGSGKWFEVPADKLLDFRVWTNLLALGLSVLFKFAYVFTFSAESRKFFIQGFLKTKEY